ALTLVHQEAPIRRAGGGDVALLEARYRASEMVAPLATAIAELFKGHVYVAARRIRGAQPAGSDDVARLTVGFVDLVGFTTLARTMEPRALAEVVESFEETARDVAALHDARVVKFVGDEVMFVAESASAACEVALSLVERFVAHGS